MTPARRSARTGRARRVKPRKSRVLMRVALAVLALGVVGVAGAAYWFGFIPGPGSVRAARELDRADDSAATDAAIAESVAAVATDSPADVDSAPPTRSAETVTVADSAAGDIVYQGIAKCGACHGTFGEGVPGTGPSLRDTALRVGDGSIAAIRRVIDGGAPASSRYRIAMPAYGGQLVREDIARVAAFVYALSHPGSVVADPPPDTSPLPGGAANADVPTGARRP